MNALYRVVGKPLLDRLTAALLLVLFSPILIGVALLIRTRLGSPVLFRQQRPGRDGRLFAILKFRTMTDQRDSQGNLLPDEQRLTALGQFLRRSSLDELPALLNVLAGQMSLIGPRPLLPQYRDRYTPEQARRQEVLPGITGLAQANGRNRLSWEEKFELDVWYVDHLSPWQDAKILWQTLRGVLIRDGISHDEHVTMPEFMGTAGQAKRVYVIGAGGHAKVVISTLHAAGYEIAGAFDDNPDVWQRTVAGVPVLGGIEAMSSHPELPAIVAIGDNATRRAIASRLTMPSPAVVHPKAYVDPTAQLGPGTVVFCGAIVQADATIGAHVIVNTSATVDHDGRIGDFAHLAPGCHLAGEVTVESEALLGAGATVIPAQRIGQGSVVGAGAVVTEEVPARSTAVGVPARTLPARRAA